LTLGADDPLRYRIQAFISRSLFLTGMLAGAMTLFLSCATVAFEIRDRQIWQLMTKPLARFSYLAGKWLGVISVNLVILLVAGVSIFAFTKYLNQQPVVAGPAGYEDRLAVRDEVLTARVGRMPEYELLEPTQLRVRVDQIIERDPTLAALDDVPRARKNEIAWEIQLDYLEQQRSIPPDNGARTYVFEGLGLARESVSNLTLRYRFHILRDDEHERFPVVFVLNENPETARLRSYVPTVTHIERIEPHHVRPDGTLAITVVNIFEVPENLRGRGELNFEADDFELLYKAGHFEANFFRAMFVTWTKLAFIAMLGIAAATLLSFPVAVLLTFTIVMGAVMSPFLAASLDQYYPPDPARMDWGSFGEVVKFVVMSGIRGVAQALVFTLGRFGEYRPGQSLVEGRQLAIYSGHG
ncbi:MAG: ABC transporter permease subunit, partial [Planctomycetota bacterium]